MAFSGVLNQQRYFFMFSTALTHKPLRHPAAAIFKDTESYFCASTAASVQGPHSEIIQQLMGAGVKWQQPALHVGEKWLPLGEEANAMHLLHNNSPPTRTKVMSQLGLPDENRLLGSVRNECFAPSGQHGSGQTGPGVLDGGWGGCLLGGGCALQATIGSQGPVLPSRGAEGAFPVFTTDLHLEHLLVTFLILIGRQVHTCMGGEEHRMWS